MKTEWATLLSLVVLGWATSATAQRSVVVQAGTSVPVELLENVHSSFSTQGETVRLRVTEDLVVGGEIAIRRGAPVEATVGNAERTGMVGKSGSISFQPIRVSAVDGQWLALDPTSFGDQGEGAGAGAIFAIGLFAKGKPGVVPRGTIYRVTVRRDTEVAVDLPVAADGARVSDLTITATLAAPQTIDLAKSKPGRDIEVTLSLPSELASLVSHSATSYRIVAFGDSSVSVPVLARNAELATKASGLVLTFDWWSVIRHSQSGATPMTIQFELTDGRLAQADVMMRSEWKLS